MDSLGSLSVLDLWHVGRQDTLQPLVSHWQSIGVTHVHPVLEESSLLGASMVKQDHRVFNRDNTIINALQLVSLWRSPIESKTYVQQKQTAVILLDNASLNKRELLLGILHEVFDVVVTVLLGHGSGEPVIWLILTFNT